MGEPAYCECGHNFVDVFGVYRHKRTGELKQFAYCIHCFRTVKPMMEVVSEEYVATESEDELEVAKVQIS